MKVTLAEWLSLFLEPDDVFEVRGLDVDRPGRKEAGFVRADRIPAMAGSIAALAVRAGGVYFTPNKLNPDVLKRSSHHLSEVVRDGDQVRPKLTGDEDVTARRYLIIDVDPVRPRAFKKHSATDAEKAQAFAVMKAVRNDLKRLGWSAPLVVDSGNGYHAYYRLCEPLPGGAVADSIADPLAQLLRTLKARFDTPGAEIDPTVFNASRVMKVPGTPSRKGPNTPERPHRTSSVLEVPSDW